jgi:hypothetical protein
MAITCKIATGETIADGDAVCVTGWNGGLGIPEVKRATAANLATSKTVLGVAAFIDAGPGTVKVLVAGDVAEATLTGLNAGAAAGTSRVVATNINGDSDTTQCRLIRINRPDGSEHIVGTCDENGHLTVQPRASRDASAQHVFNVKSYGAKGDGRFVPDGTMSPMSNVLISSTAGWSTADIGKTIVVRGAATYGLNLKTTIAGYDPLLPDRVTLVAAAQEEVVNGIVVWGTDNLPAFKACQEAMSNLVIQRAGIFFVPPIDSTADVYYFLSDDFEVLCQARYEGTGVGGHNSGARILFAPGKGFRIRGATVASVLGDATDCIIAGFDIRCLPDKYLRWNTSGFTPQVGQKFRMRCQKRVDEPGVGNGEWIVYYECIHSAPVEPGPEPDFWAKSCQLPDLSRVWTANTPVHGGTLVRGKDWTHWDVVFECIDPPNAYRTTHSTTQPTWDYTLGTAQSEPEDPAHPPPPTWYSKKSDTCLIRHGGAWFACRTAAAIHSYGVCTIERNAIKGCLGPGIHITSNMKGVPQSGSSFSRIENNYIITPQGEKDPAGKFWGGVGMAIYSNDANGLEITGNRVIGDAPNYAHVIERRENNHPYAVGDRVKSQWSVDIDQTLLFTHFECTKAGTTAGSEPADFRDTAKYVLGATIDDDGTPPNAVNWKAVSCPPNYGYYDRGYNGNQHFAGRAENTSGPGFALLSLIGRGGTYGCHSENAAGDVYVAGSAVYGGTASYGTTILSGTAVHAGRITNAISESTLSGSPTPSATTLLAPRSGALGPQSLTWQSSWWLGPTAPLSLTSDVGQALFLIDSATIGPRGWWWFVAGTSVDQSAWGWSTSQALLADPLDPNRLVGANVFQITRSVLFGNQLDVDQPFLWFTSPTTSQDYTILGCYRRKGDRRCKAAAGAEPGAFLDQVVTTPGYEAPTIKRTPPGYYDIGSPRGAQNALPAQVVQADGRAYRCTRSGTVGATPPATWPATVAKTNIALTWKNSLHLRVGDCVRPTSGPEFGKSIYRVTGFTVDYRDGHGPQNDLSLARTSPTGLGPVWPNAGTITETWPAPAEPSDPITVISYTREKDDTDTWVEDGGVIWTYVGNLAQWTDANPVLGASLLKSAAYTLLTNDRHVTFTAGVTATLPANPTDGQTHSVKSRGSFTLTLAGNGKNIDGAATYAQSGAYACTTVRYSAAVGEWEVISR